MKFPRYFSLLLALAMLLCAVLLAVVAVELFRFLFLLRALEEFVVD